ncbi:hypothetical protein ACJZ2D_013159 [Fusarium nematophilum]
MQSCGAVYDEYGSYVGHHWRIKTLEEREKDMLRFEQDHRDRMNALDEEFWYGGADGQSSSNSLGGSADPTLFFSTG